MSQLPSASRPASRSPTDGRNISLPPVQLRDDGQKVGLPEGRGVQQDLEGQAAVRATQQAETMQHPQASQAATLEDEQRGAGSSRSLGVHNILNPPESEPSGSSTPRLGTGITRSPQLLSQAPLYTTNPPLFPQGYVGQQTGTAVTAAEVQRATSTRGRKYAPLKSPRAISLGSRAAATRDARQSPFLSSGGVYTAEPGTGPLSEVPPMPVTAGTAQQPYSYAAGPPPRRASTTTMSAPTRAPLSQSASPSTPIISSYSQPSQSSPAVRHQLGQPYLLFRPVVWSSFAARRSISPNRPSGNRRSVHDFPAREFLSRFSERAKPKHQAYAHLQRAWGADAHRGGCASGIKDG